MSFWLAVITLFSSASLANEGSGATPSIDLLRPSVMCEVAVIDSYLKTALPLINSAPSPDANARQAHTKAWELKRSAEDLLKVGEINLAYQRTRSARKLLKTLVRPLWDLKADARLSPVITAQLECARVRLNATQPHLQNHALNGPSKAFALSKERLEGATLGQRQGEHRLAFFKLNDGLHQLDVAIGWQWSQTTEN